MPADNGGLRASDADRAAVVAQLKEHYEAGRLTLAEMEERTRQAYAARTQGELDGLLQDLPPPAAPSHPSPPPTADTAPPPRNGLRRQLGGYVVVMVFLVGIWALSGGGYFWPAWPMLAWGFALVMRLVRGEPLPDRPLRHRHRRDRWQDP